MTVSQALGWSGAIMLIPAFAFGIATIDSLSDRRDVYKVCSIASLGIIVLLWLAAVWVMVGGH